MDMGGWSSSGLGLAERPLGRVKPRQMGQRAGLGMDEEAQ